MNRLPASKARERISDILNEVAFGGERVVLHRHGKDVAAVISVEDLRRFEELEDRYDLELMREARAERGPNVPWEQLKAEIGTADFDAGE